MLSQPSICNDVFYPEVRTELLDDYDRPLKLLARELAFVDPITECERHFISSITMDL